MRWSIGFTACPLANDNYKQTPSNCRGGKGRAGQRTRLIVWSNNAYYTNSHRYQEPEIHGQGASPIGHANHRKSNSCPETASQGPADPRAPDRDRGQRLIKATQDNRYSHRDATMVLLAYRHWEPPCTSAGSSRARPARIRSSPRIARPPAAAS